MSQIYTYNYSSAYNPAMPAVDILIGRALSTATVELSAIVDSGADATIIPMTHLQAIQARRSRQMWMRGTAGGRIIVDLYQISLQLGDFVQARLEVVGDKQGQEVILGRDILNHMTITLDGPASSVQVLGER